METIATNITDEINMLIEDYLLMNEEFEKASDINDGWCADFAFDIKQGSLEQKRVGEMNLTKRFGIDVDGWVEYHVYGHCFIVFKDRYYDSEAPNGVDHPKDLPFYQRELESVEKSFSRKTNQIVI